MKFLAIETATEACSVAVHIDGRVIERHELAPRLHAQRILPMIDAALAAAGASKRELDFIAVGRGPGAFTGVRLAISIAQGLALGLDRPVVTVSTLAALALAAPAGADAISAAIDARMGEIYSAWFERDVDDLVTVVGDERVAAARDAAESGGKAFVAIGSGWATYGEALAARLGRPESTAADALPHAADIARLALRDFHRGLAVDAAHALPVYLRDKIALTRLEQQAARAAKV